MLVLEDLLIDGYKIYQDDCLYRFTSDAVILSKFASVKKREIVADFCSGSGIVGLHYYALNKNAEAVDLFEIQKPLYELSEKTIKLNNLQNIFHGYNMPIQEITNDFNSKYTLILCNPPYKKKDSGEKNLSPEIAMARHEVCITQEEIIACSFKKLKDGGRLCICQRVERFTDLITELRKNRLEPKYIQFVAKSQSAEPYLVLVEAVKNVKPQLKVLPTFINSVKK